MHYDTLLKESRLRQSRVYSSSTLEENADADRGRVLFCAPFRRLQKKAQVFSLEMNAAVRTRLTHSLEVSSIGRLVAQEALRALEERSDELGLQDKKRAFTTFVETACLIHDIGNPPFGHFGELTISEWFEDNVDDVAPDCHGLAEPLWHRHLLDFKNFDGNPQGFRIITRLQPDGLNDLHGLNLTLTTLASVMKYPWASDNLGKDRKKNGFFQTEADVIQNVWRALDIPCGCRHPLAFLLEAADDIAYCISDMEDGIEKGYIDPIDFANAIMNDLKETRFAKESRDDEMTVIGSLTVLRDTRGTALVPMQSFRSAFLREVAKAAGEEFASRQHEILSGTIKPLLKVGDAAALLEALKAYAKAKLYVSKVVRERELTAHAVLTGLLNAYKSLLSCPRSRFECIVNNKSEDGGGGRVAEEASLYSRISRKCIEVYHAFVASSDKEMPTGQRDVMERVHRIHMVLDYICGMTDDYALATHRLILGSSE